MSFVVNHCVQNFIHPVFRENCYDESSCAHVETLPFHIGEDIHAGFPHLYVVAWRTVVQDRVAQAFAREFYTYLGVESSKGNRGSVAEAYAAAERDFHAKYREGDPTVYDEAGNRTGKKDSSVHGVPMLLRPVGWS